MGVGRQSCDEGRQHVLFFYLSQSLRTRCLFATAAKASALARYVLPQGLPSELRKLVPQRLPWRTTAAKAPVDRRLKAARRRASARRNGRRCCP